MVEEGVVLKDETGTTSVGAIPCHIPTIEKNFATVPAGEFQAGDDSKKGGLAGAAGSEVLEGLPPLLPKTRRSKRGSAQRLWRYFRRGCSWIGGRRITLAAPFGNFGWESLGGLAFEVNF